MPGRASASASVVPPQAANPPRHVQSVAIWVVAALDPDCAEARLCPRLARVVEAGAAVGRELRCLLLECHRLHQRVHTSRDRLTWRQPRAKCRASGKSNRRCVANDQTQAYTRYQGTPSRPDFKRLKHLWAHGTSRSKSMSWAKLAAAPATAPTPSDGCDAPAAIDERAHSTGTCVCITRVSLHFMIGASI